MHENKSHEFESKYALDQGKIQRTLKQIKIAS